MNSTFLRSYTYFLILFTGFLLTGCSHTGKSFNTKDQAAQDIISSIQVTNNALKTFKGIGSVKMNSNNQLSSFRLAWVGKNPDKLRLVVLVSGKTIESFAANGESIFLKSHTKTHKFIKKKAKNADLKRIISIPIKTKEIISLLSGKIPLKSYKYTSLIKSPDNKGYILELAKFWSGTRERIFLNQEKKPTGFEMVKGGKAVYKVSLNNFKNINGFILPFEIFIETTTTKLNIKYSNYFTNSEIKEKTFTLSDF